MLLINANLLIKITVLLYPNDCNLAMYTVKFSCNKGKIVRGKIFSVNRTFDICSVPLRTKYNFVLAGKFGKKFFLCNRDLRRVVQNVVQISNSQTLEIRTCLFCFETRFHGTLSYFRRCSFHRTKYQ